MPICYTHLLRPLVVQMYGVCKCAETGGISEAVLWYKDSSKAVLLSVFSSQLMYCIYASMLHHQTTHSIHRIMACLQVGVTTHYSYYFCLYESIFMY